MAALLNLAIFLPLATGVVVLLLPTGRPGALRWTALIGTGATLFLVAALWADVSMTTSGLQHRTTLPWVPGIGASYDVAIDGLSLPLLSLTAVLFFAVSVYVLPKADRVPSHAFLFLLMETGLLGLFAAQDLLLFYVFFEVALVPMYFVIGGWGHEDRRYAAMKFFLYTRGASLAMLLGILGLYLSMEPRTFSLPAIAEQRPLAGSLIAGSLVLFGLLIGFLVKVPSIPLHNWLPDAHVEAPTEGSVVLAGLQLKMGGYGLFRVALATVPEAAERWGWLLVVLGVASLVYGALAALAQSDFKRLIAYSSVAHMGYVTLAAGVYVLSPDDTVRSLAWVGAVYQMVSHGLLTGGMFFLAGILQDHSGTREIPRIGGLMRRLPLYAALLSVLAFGSLGIPGMSGFIAELQVIGATVSLSVWAAAFTVLGLLVTTGLYLVVVTRLVLGTPPAGAPALSRPDGRELGVVLALAALSILLGVAPSPLMALIEPSSLAPVEVAAP